MTDIQRAVALDGIRIILVTRPVVALPQAISVLEAIARVLDARDEDQYEQVVEESRVLLARRTHIAELGIYTAILAEAIAIPPEIAREAGKALSSQFPVELLDFIRTVTGDDAAEVHQLYAMVHNCRPGEVTALWGMAAGLSDSLGITGHDIRAVIDPVRYAQQ